MEVDEVVEPAPNVRQVRTVPTTRYRAVYLVWFVASVIDVIVGLRFLLELLAASPQAPFVSLVYGVSAPLVKPFQGIFPAPAQSGFFFDSAALVALLIYPLIAAGIVGVVRLTTGRRTYA
jgi:uncharacterized protein YggT (Ycf19 family)